MQVSVESIGKLERRMQVQVPAERVSEEIAARLKNISRTARLNGFRPGKAPLKVIRQQFGSQIHREVIGELLQSSYAEAVTQKQLTPASSRRAWTRARTLNTRRPSKCFPKSFYSRWNLSKSIA
jgi:trigger factor